MVSRLRSTSRKYGRWHKRHQSLRNRVRPCAVCNTSQIAWCEADAHTVYDDLEQLRQIYQQTIHNHEAERRQLAHELHDETLQQLADISVRIGLMRTQQALDMAGLADLQARLARADDRLREIVRGVHPAVLVDLGLVEAVISFLETRVADTGNGSVRVTLSVIGFGPHRLPDQSIELTLYRFVQNAVINALKHAMPGHIDVIIDWQADAVRVNVSDDGCGMQRSLEDAVRAGRFGLLSMRERVRGHDGKFALCSASDSGTRVSGVIPLTIMPPAERKTETYVMDL